VRLRRPYVIGGNACSDASSVNGMVRPCSCPASKRSWQGGANDKAHAMSQTPNTAIAVIGIDIGSFQSPPFPVPVGIFSPRFFLERVDLDLDGRGSVRMLALSFVKGRLRPSRRSRSICLTALSR
jgi:hypothetical protein